MHRFAAQLSIDLTWYSFCIDSENSRHGMINEMEIGGVITISMVCRFEVNGHLMILIFSPRMIVMCILFRCINRAMFYMLKHKTSGKMCLESEICYP